MEFNRVPTKLLLMMMENFVVLTMYGVEGSELMTMIRGTYTCVMALTGKGATLKLPFTGN